MAGSVQFLSCPSDLGINQRAPADSRGDWGGDADTMDTRATRFHGKGLALSIRPSEGESSLASPVAEIRGVMVGGRAYRFR